MLSSSAKNSQILSHSFFRRFWGWNNSGAVKLRYQSIHKRFSTWINILVTRSLRLELLAEHWNFFKVPDAKCMNIRAAKIIKHVQSGHYCAKSSCIVFHSIVFYSKNILKTLTKPWQAKQFCWHLVNMGRNSNWIVPYHDFLIWNKQPAGSYPHLYNMLCTISVFRTVHHWSPVTAKQMQSI